MLSLLVDLPPIGCCQAYVRVQEGNVHYSVMQFPSVFLRVGFVAGSRCFIKYSKNIIGLKFNLICREETDTLVLHVEN